MHVLCCRSLEARILPRLKAMRAAGVTPSFAEHHWHVVSYTDKRFRSWLKQRLQENAAAAGITDTLLVRELVTKCFEMLQPPPGGAGGADDA
jgi:hypothetical protein